MIFPPAVTCSDRFCCFYVTSSPGYLSYILVKSLVFLLFHMLQFTLAESAGLSVPLVVAELMQCPPSLAQSS